MLSYEFKTYIKDGREVVLFGEHSIDGVSYTKRDFPFPESLMTFLRLDIWKYEPLFKKMDRALRELYPSRDEKFAREIEDTLNELAGVHFYFELLRLDWRWRLEQAAQKNYEGSTRLLPHKFLSQMPSELFELQKQINDLLENALDIDKDKRLVSERMADYYRKYGNDTLRTFQFKPQPTNFELVDDTFAEVLYPADIYDLIDYHVRQCVKQELRMRVCKNCGYYFAISGWNTTEYCDVTRDEKGRTCKEFGAIALWTQKRSQDEVFKVYRREYKKRFAWIRAGKIDPDKFYAWSEQARAQKAKCEAGEISLEEFAEWLGNS